MRADRGSPPRWFSVCVMRSTNSRAPDHGAGDDIGMPVEILGPAMNREIEAEFRGPKIDRTREGVVDDRDQPVLRREIHRRLKSVTCSSGFDIAST